MVITYLPTFETPKSGHPISEVSNGSVAYDDFEGQENTFFILITIFDKILFSHKISEIENLKIRTILIKWRQLADMQ